MRVSPDDLPRRLENGLPAAVLLFGDEPLLIEESARLARRAARAQGFADRIPLNVETGFDWSRLTDSAATLSLFAERRLIELRLAGGRPGESGTRALGDCLEAATADVCLLVIAGRLDARAKQAKWVKLLDGGGWLVEHRALKPGAFQGWFRRRLQDRGLKLDKPSIERMCHFLEGNLLAAAQEIDRIALFADEHGRVDPDAVARGLGDHARFNVYAFADACLDGKPRTAFRVLQVLRNEGTEPTLVAWALARELRTVQRIAHGLGRGESRQRLFKAHNVWSTREPLYDAVLARLGENQLRGANRQMAHCDKVIKGRASGDIWQEIEVMVLMICDVRYATETPMTFHAAG